MDLSWTWSYLLAAVGVTGLYYAGKKRRVGWFIGFLAQFLWVAYAIFTNQYGFILSAIPYAWVYLLNWQRWKPD